jgi:hypothetical protein
MPGLVPGIHVLTTMQKDVDGRDKPGHDETLDRYYFKPLHRSANLCSGRNVPFNSLPISVRR